MAVADEVAELEADDDALELLDAELELDEDALAVADDADVAELVFVAVAVEVAVSVCFAECVAVADSGA